MANPTTAQFTNGLVLYLKFDGNYGDSSGRGNNASAVGAPQIVSGKLGSGGLKFATDTGASTFDYLTLGTPADLQFGTATDFSVGYWVRTEPGATNGDLPFLCSATNSYGNPGLTFAPQDSSQWRRKACSPGLDSCGRLK